MSSPTTPLAPHLSAWLRQRLPVERGASRHTCDAYATAFQLLVTFAAEKTGKSPSELVLEQLNSTMVIDFLDHLQQKRGCSPRTRNARLAAIRSFMRFMEHRDARALEQCRQVLAIPFFRTKVEPIRHLDPDQAKAILDAPDPRTRDGVRDRAMLHVALTGGLRVSELVGLRLDEVTFRDRYVDLRVRGKGKKERAITLWKVVADGVRAWLAVRGTVKAPELFVNARGEALSRSGAEYILERHVKAATLVCPSLATVKVSPHVLRHTCAMTTLRATRDIRKVALWLGHASTQTTEVYLHQDPVDRIETLEAVVPPSLRPGTFAPPDKLLAMLKGR